MKIQFNPKDDITVKELAFVVSQLNIGIVNIGIFNKFPESIKKHFTVDVEGCPHSRMEYLGPQSTVNSGLKYMYNCLDCKTTITKDFKI